MLPTRQYAGPNLYPHETDVKALKPRIDQIRELVVQLAGHGSLDLVGRAAVILLAATIAGQDTEILRRVTGEHAAFIDRIKRAARELEIFTRARGIKGGFSKVDITDWWKPREGDAALLLDAMACLGLLARVMDADGVVRYGKSRAAPAKTAPAPPPPEPEPEPPEPGPEMEPGIGAPPVRVIKPARAKRAPNRPRGTLPKAIIEGHQETRKDGDFWWLDGDELDDRPKIDGIDKDSKESQAVKAAFQKARVVGASLEDGYIAAARAWRKLHPDHDPAAAAQRAMVALCGESWQTPFMRIRHRVDELRERHSAVNEVDRDRELTDRRNAKKREGH